VTTLSSSASVTIAATLFAGLFMLQLGLRKKTIRWRLSSRCPSCGLIRRTAYCKRCGS